MKFFNLSLYILAGILFVAYCMNISGEIISESSTFERLEIIGNEKFLYKNRIENGKTCREEWVVNDKPLNKIEFSKAKFDAKKIEWEKEEKEIEDRDLQDQQYRKSIRIEILRKLLSLKLAEVKKYLDKTHSLETRNLSNYFVFDKQTFISKDELEKFRTEFIKEVEGALKKVDENLDLVDLNSYLTKLELYNEKLENFFQVSLKNAITTCDDAKVLRDLLEFS